MPELVRALYHDALALSAGRHRVLLDVATGDGLLGAEEELRSAFGNLISNAVRYTPERGRGRDRLAARRRRGELQRARLGHRHRRRSTFRGSPSAFTAWTGAARARPAARGWDSRS